MKYFLIVYNTESGELLESVRTFSERDLAAALEERFAREREHAAESGIEVVLLRAPSEAAIRSTHGRYFASPSKLMEAAGKVIRKKPSAPRHKVAI